MTTAATLLIGIGIAITVLLYIVVQRLDQIIALQTEQRGEQQEWLAHITDLLEVPYGAELDRKRREKTQWETSVALANFANERGIPVPEKHASRLRHPPKG